MDWLLKNLGLLAVVPLLLLVASCSTSPAPVVTETRVIVQKKMDPPLPSPIQVPPEIEIQVITPEVARQMIEDVEDGKRLPFTFFAMNDQDWLSFAQWLQDALRYIRQVNTIVDYYRNDDREPEQKIE